MEKHIDWSKPVKVLIQMYGWKVFQRWVRFPSYRVVHARLIRSRWSPDQYGHYEKRGERRYVARGTDTAIRASFRIERVVQCNKRDLKGLPPLRLS